MARKPSFCNIFCFLVTSIILHILCCGAIPVEERSRRRLNTNPFDNVLSEIQPLLPINGLNPDEYEHSDHDEVIFVDRECARTTENADHLRLQLIEEEQDCLIANKYNQRIYSSPQNFYFFLQWNVEQDVDCMKHIDIDFEAFCISKIEYEPIVREEAVNSVFMDCVDYSIPSNDFGAWFLDDIQGEVNGFSTNYYEGGSYSAPYFEDNNVIIYILDSVVNMDHDHFSHIPDANKQTLGTIYPNDDWDHGTHVAGLAVGNIYGVIRDPGITLKACNCLPEDGQGTVSQVDDCLSEVLDDLKTERMSNPKKRGVVNLSLSYSCSGVEEYFDPLFQEIKANGGVIVVAAGNQGGDACDRSPACSDEVISVGATRWDQHRGDFSNYGDCIHAWAPGQFVKSSYYDGTYRVKYGTSMAAPIIAGILGQIINLNPDENVTSVETLKSILIDPEYTYNVSDCMDSATCSAFTLSCDGFKDLYLSLNDINGSSLESECVRATCTDLEWSGTKVWGQKAQGIDLSAYTNDELQWMGCITSWGCKWYCNDLSTASIEFGTDGRNAPRALLGPGSYPNSYTNCGSESIPRDILNWPNTKADAVALCRQLGYTSGSVATVGEGYGYCAPAHWDGMNWTSDYTTNYDGYGIQIRCFGADECLTSEPTVSPSDTPTFEPTELSMGSTVDLSESPTANPTGDASESPTMNPTNDPSVNAMTMNPTKDPTDEPLERPTMDPTMSPVVETTADEVTTTDTVSVHAAMPSGLAGKLTPAPDLKRTTDSTIVSECDCTTTTEIATDSFNESTEVNGNYAEQISITLVLVLCVLFGSICN